MNWHKYSSIPFLIICTNGCPQNLCNFFVFRGEKIKVDLKLKASVGDDNFADIKLDGEASEAAKAFANNGYLAALNGNMEICHEKSKVVS